MTSAYARGREPTGKRVSFLLGYDVEAPFDQPFVEAEVSAAVMLSLEMVRKLNMLLNAHALPRTFFVLGRFLESGLHLHGRDAIRDVFEMGNPLVDIQSHGYSHRQYRDIPIDPSRKSLSPDEVYDDIERAQRAIHAIFGIQPVGLRTPRGYAQGLGEDTALVRKISEAGMTYVSSDLRDSDWRIYTELYEKGRIRQPRSYPGGLIEMPSHGWQDTAFSGLEIPGIPDFAGLGCAALQSFIVDHYTSILDEALIASRAAGDCIYIGACFHPQAVFRYDPELVALEQIIRYALERDVRITSYTSACSEVLARCGAMAASGVE